MIQRLPRSEHPDRIEPVAFRHPAPLPVRRRRVRTLPVALAGLLGLLAICAWFLFTAQAVRLDINPEPDAVAIEGGISIPLGGRYLLRPGRYTVLAEKAGYRPLNEPIEVRTGDEHPTFRYHLTKLPGRLAVRSVPGGATVIIDGQEAGRTPLDPVSLAPGIHALTVRADGHEVHHAEVAIEGGDVLQAVEVELTPAWAPITFRSEPAGATVLVDGQEQGTTPVTAELDAGGRRVVLRLAGHQPWVRDLEVIAGQAQELPIARLLPAPGHLRITSEPAGASVVVAREFRGRTPLTLSLPPERTVTVQLVKAGHQPTAREVRLAADETKTLALTLTPIQGTIEVRAVPADATLYVDGEAQGAADQTLSLAAVPHVLEIRKPGYVTYRTTVTPKPTLAQQLTPRLQTEAEAQAGALPPVVRTAAAQELRLVQPGSFTMGSPRREQGRRANEAQRQVRLTRMFYIGTHEVTNAEFRQFRPNHSSGIIGRLSLDNDNHPVVRVTWQDAARYCNWLSEREGLPPAYREGPQGPELVTPLTTGYRLPTEAEWAWAARFAAGRDLKYPWGQAMPPTGKAGNYGDASAAALGPERLETYDDGYAASAPVGRFAANALGLYDMGGNVSEWVHDYYDMAPPKEATDPLGPASGSAHTVRGSSWRHGRITQLRLAYRDSAAGARDDLGFRLARYAN